MEVLVPVLTEYRELRFSAVDAPAGLSRIGSVAKRMSREVTTPRLPWRLEYAWSSRISGGRRFPAEINPVRHQREQPHRWCITTARACS